MGNKVGRWVIVNKLHCKKVVGKWSANHLFMVQLVHDYLAGDFLVVGVVQLLYTKQNMALFYLQCWEPF